ncbi:hypothetical protein F5Y19DRAFT_295895 [Xylariaceae sp. FL1651]|nr:hypothetical protein F5Y19DRAFT_295895 [Xylariaceae sp. FL1651]
MSTQFCNILGEEGVPDADGDITMSEHPCISDLSNTGANLRPGLASIWEGNSIFEQTIGMESDQSGDLRYPWTSPLGDSETNDAIMDDPPNHSVALHPTFNFDIDTPNFHAEVGVNNTLATYSEIEAMSASESQESQTNNSYSRRTRLNSSQRRVLELWISSHDEPYPTKDDKIVLSEQTGLSIDQVSSWFSRTRQRKLQRISVPNIRRDSCLGGLDKSVGVSPLSQDISDARDSWPTTMSLPNRRKSSPHKSRFVQRSQSLPLPYYTLRNIRQYSHHGCRRVPWQGESLDVAPSIGNATSSSDSQRRLVVPSQQPDPSFRSLYRQEGFKAIFIVHWLKGISNHTESVASPASAFVRPNGNVDKIVDQSMDRSFGDFEYSGSFPLPPSSMNAPRPPRSSHYLSLDSASTTWSHDLDVSSTASYIPFSSRKGRRQAFHPQELSERVARAPSHKRELIGPEEQHPARRKTEITSVASLQSAPAAFSRESNLTQPPNKPKRYYCTFCPSNFDKLFTWKRHEESVHAPRKHWICALPRHLPEGFEWQCPICDNPLVADPSRSMECGHGFPACWNKPKQDRTFYRRDALKQHLCTVHFKGPQSPSIGKLQLDDWTEEVDTSMYDLKCYFCGHVNSDMDERAKHIIGHFDNGETMDQWLLAKKYRFFPPISIQTEPSKGINHEGKYVGYSNSGGCDRPPNIYESLQRHQGEPPMEDMEPSDPDLIPYKLDLASGGLFLPNWLRNRGGELECWCGLCRPGRWVRYWKSGFGDHMCFSHGIDCRNKRPFMGPLEMRHADMESPDAWEGLCASCHNWIALTSGNESEPNWFRHAEMCSSKLLKQSRRR